MGPRYTITRVDGEDTSMCSFFPYRVMFKTPLEAREYVKRNSHYDIVFDYNPYSGITVGRDRERKTQTAYYIQEVYDYVPESS